MWKLNPQQQWDRYSFAPKYNNGVAGLRQKERPVTLVLENGHYKALLPPKDQRTPKPWLFQANFEIATLIIDLTGGGPRSKRGQKQPVRKTAETTQEDTNKNTSRSSKEPMPDSFNSKEAASLHTYCSHPDDAASIHTYRSSTTFAVPSSVSKHAEHTHANNAMSTTQTGKHIKTQSFPVLELPASTHGCELSIPASSVAEERIPGGQEAKLHSHEDIRDAFDESASLSSPNFCDSMVGSDRPPKRLRGKQPSELAVDQPRSSCTPFVVINDPKISVWWSCECGYQVLKHDELSCHGARRKKH